MFERFTADARRTVELAVEVAEEIGHGYLGAEHLLIALAGTGPSIATEALTACGFLWLRSAPSTARSRADRAVGGVRSQRGRRRRSSRDRRGSGRGSPKGRSLVRSWCTGPPPSVARPPTRARLRLRVMPKAKQALVLALREAIRLGHRRIGPEHVLGLLRLIAMSTQLLLAQGIDARRLREEVLRGSEDLEQRGA